MNDVSQIENASVASKEHCDKVNRYALFTQEAYLYEYVLMKFILQRIDFSIRFVSSPCCSVCFRICLEIRVRAET